MIPGRPGRFGVKVHFRRPGGAGGPPGPPALCSDLGGHEALPQAAMAVGDVLQDVGVGVHDRHLVVERPWLACHVGRDQGFTRTSWRKMR